MPTLVRFFIVLIVLAVAVGAAMVYLANFVEPNSREMTVRIPSSRLEPTVVVPSAVTVEPAEPVGPAPEPAPGGDGPAAPTVETAPE